MVSGLALAYINLALFLIVLGWLAKGPALKAVKESKEEYHKALAEASKLAKEAQAMKSDLVKKKQNLKSDLERLHGEVLKSAQVEIKRIEEETEVLVSFFKEETKRLEEAEYKRVKKEIADKVLLAASQRLAKNYSQHSDPKMDAQILTAKTNILKAKCQELEQNHG